MTTPIAERPPRMALEQQVLLWRLYRGGITDNALLRRVTGTNLHGMAMRGAITAMEAAFKGPLPLKEYIRCRSCGGLIATVPCVCCGPDQDAYRFTGKVRNGS